MNGFDRTGRKKGEGEERRDGGGEQILDLGKETASFRSKNRMP